MMELENKKLFEGEFLSLIVELKDCLIWVDRVYESFRLGQDIIYPFINLRNRTQSLVYTFMSLFKKHWTPSIFKDQKDKKDIISKVINDMQKFVAGMFDPKVALAISANKIGEILTATSYINQFLQYLHIVIESTYREVSEDLLPKSFIKNSLRNAGLVPSLKDLYELAKKEEMA